MKSKNDQPKTKKSEGRTGDGLYKKRDFWYFRAPDSFGIARPISSRTKNLNEAKKFKTDYLKAMEDGVDLAKAGRILLKDAVEMWKDDLYLNLEGRSTETYDCAAAHLVRGLGGLPLGKIKAHTLKAYQKMRQKSGAGASTINKETGIVRSILIERKIWAKVKEDYKPLKEPASIGRKLADEEIDLIDAPNPGRCPDYIIAAFDVLIESGLRHAELRTIRRRNVDLVREQFVVERDTTKSDAGVRIVPMSAKALEVAASLLARAEAMGSVLPQHYLFPGYRNVDHHRIVDPTKPLYTFWYAWTRLKQLKGVDPSLRVHDGRHHFLTEMASANISSAEAMKLVGHTSLKQRVRYEHLQTSIARDAMNQMEAKRKERTKAKPKTTPNVVEFPVRKAS